MTSDFLLSSEAELEERALRALDGSHRMHVCLDVGLLNDADIYIHNYFHILHFFVWVMFEYLLTPPLSSGEISVCIPRQ